MKKPQLVDNWQQSWKWFSSQALAMSTTIPLVWLGIPEEMRSSVPVEWVMAITAVTAACGLVGRLVKQGD